MKLLLVNITDPRKEKLVTDILNEIEGVQVHSSTLKAESTKRLPKKAAKGKPVKSVTPKEKKFVKGLTQAFKEMDAHIKGKRKLKSLKEVLDEL